MQPIWNNNQPDTTGDHPKGDRKNKDGRGEPQQLPPVEESSSD